MTFNNFIKKCGLKKWDALSLYMLFSVLDRLYLEFTPEQVREIVDTQYKNADDIYNDIEAQLDENVKEVEEILFAKTAKAQYNKNV